jgi:hypothetical protein
MQTDRQTDIAKRFGTFLYFAKASKNIVRMLVKSSSQVLEPNIVTMKMVQRFAPKHCN